MIPKEFNETIKHIEEYNNYLTGFEQEEVPDEFSHLPPQELQRKEYEASPEYRKKLQIKEIFNKEYKELIDTEKYFLGCSHKIYTTTYDERLQVFLTLYTDSQEHNFIYDELLKLTHLDLPYYLDNKIVKSINYSIERTKEFLIDKLKDEFVVSFSIDDNGLQTLSIKNSLKDLSIHKTNNSLVKWITKPTHLVELGMALIETQSVNVGKGQNQISENKFYKLLASFFNVEKLPHEKYKGDIRNRVKDQTVLLPQLDNTLQKAINDRLK